jgi:hypothetical protein
MVMSHRYIAYLKFLADRDGAVMMLAAFALFVVLAYALTRHRAGRVWIVSMFLAFVYSMVRL